jgi:molecular chaperone GrpE
MNTQTNTNPSDPPQASESPAHQAGHEAATPDISASPGHGTANGMPASSAEGADALDELQAKYDALSDAFLRAKAEAENTRRRADEEMSKARKFAIESFADSLLPVKDSLEAAMAQPGASTDQVLEGVQATLRQLTAALERNKVMAIAPPPGTKFDPHQHQAISVVPAEQDAHTVVSVLQKGYLIADRVLRPALVTVAAPK